MDKCEADARAHFVSELSRLTQRFIGLGPAGAEWLARIVGAAFLQENTGGQGSFHIDWGGGVLTIEGEGNAEVNEAPPDAEAHEPHQP